MKIKKGDQVKIVTGNDKNKQGKVLAVLPHVQKIVVDGMNIKKKHVRSKQQGKKGELVRIPMPFSVSRAMLLCPQCGKAARAGFKLSGTKKVRICKKCGAEV